MARLEKTPFPGFEFRAGEDYRDYDARATALLREIEARHTIWRTPVADGYAMYAVVNERPLTLKHIPYGDGYQAAGATIRGLTMAEVDHQRRADAAFKAMRDEAEGFYESLQPGQTVHFHHGFGEYVRCEVVVKDGRKELRPTALVGKWREYDLPRRQPDGTVYEGHYPKMVRTGETLRPHASCIWEYEKCANKGRMPDPTGMPEVDLTVPDMSGEEAERARLWRRVEAIRGLVNRTDGDPAAILEAVRQAAA